MGVWEEGPTLPAPIYGNRLPLRQSGWLCVLTMAGFSPSTLRSPGASFSWNVVHQECPGWLAPGAWEWVLQLFLLLSPFSCSSRTPVSFPLGILKVRYRFYLSVAPCANYAVVSCSQHCEPCLRWYLVPRTADTDCRPAGQAEWDAHQGNSQLQFQ